VRWQYGGAMVQRHFGGYALVALYLHIAVIEGLARAAAARGELEEAHHAKHHGARFVMEHAGELVHDADVRCVDELPAVAGIVGHCGRHAVKLVVPAADAAGLWERQRGPVAQVQAGFVAALTVGVPLARLCRLPDLVSTVVGIGVADDQYGQMEVVGVAVLLVAERLELFCKPLVQMEER
jgi:hypothetical protein